ncbi:hypothetical protein [Cupriavidus necator]|nr:hypothetical protein [Cupriavidus necator]
MLKLEGMAGFVAVVEAGAIRWAGLHDAAAVAWIAGDQHGA